MPLTSLYLVSLDPSTSVSTFIPLLLSSLPRLEHPLLIARPLRWIIDPWISSPSAVDEATLKALTAPTWDLLLVFPSVVDLPGQMLNHIKQSYVLQVGISSKIIASFHKTNAALLHPSPGSIPSLTGSLDKGQTSSSSKDLMLTPALREWFSSASAPKSAPSMLNFLAVLPGKLDSYKAYGRAFAEDVGARRGGLAKIVGSVVTPGDGTQAVWDEIAVAHYPSVWHFADMTMGDDYQAVNKKHRVGALRGTAILCCDELDVEVLKGLEAAQKSRAKM